jgi:hypothetical protein
VNQRLQLHRTKGWRKPAGAICVTRPGPWGNPFTTAEAFEEWLGWGCIRVGDLQPEYFPFDTAAKRSLKQRRDWMLAHIIDLVGHDLMCWCPPTTGVKRTCHGDVLLMLAAQKVECPGHGRGGTGDPCCDRAGQYNGFGSDGPLSFICPQHCACHD